MIDKNKIRFLILALLLAIIFYTCESSMGMGHSVDLEPPTLKITGIVLPDGTEIPLLEDDNKLFVGPGILVGPGFYLKGTAWDNENVVRITVEETGSGAEIVGGKPRIWTDANISLNKSESGVWGGEYDWTISLDGISPGERNILVTVYDFPGNIGPNSVKQLTLLVDLDPPFIDKINIERQAGITVGLLPRTRLEQMDPALFDEIDYFQNENFTIRASISHNFSLSGVTLNLIDEDGNKLFKDGLERINGTTVYAPSWHITADQIIAANQIYSSGRRYLKVIITARAEAGHSGQNEDKTNLLYNLCWYPEADIPNMQMTVTTTEENEVYRFEKGSSIPVRVFDDDNIEEVHAALITLNDWNNYMKGSEDNVKLQSLINNFSVFTGLSTNMINTPARNAVIEVKSGETRGDYRLIIFVKDKKDSGKPGVWGMKIINIDIVEEGIPNVTVVSPSPNTSPKLENGKNIVITGNIQNLDNLDKVKIAWISDSIENANAKGQEALLSGNIGVVGNGIKIWEMHLLHGEDITFASGKVYKKQVFSFTFDIFTDFIYNNQFENKNKLFIIYARGKGGDDVFENFNLLSYSKPPTLNVEPKSWDREYAPGGEIKFEIEAVSPDGVQIEDDAVTLWSNYESKWIPLTRQVDIWKGTNSHSAKREEGYSYAITAADKLGIQTLQTVTVRVTDAPKIKLVTSPHNSGSVFSGRDTVTIQAVFDSAVTTVTGAPRLRLEGFTSSPNVRYANYAGGEATTTLNFEYKVQANDYTGAPGPSAGLTVTAFELNGGSITAYLPDISALQSAEKLPATKRLNIDGRAPKITNITFTGIDGDTAYPGWYREGMGVEARVEVDKEISLVGTPNLLLQFTGGTRQASFQKMDNNNKTMVFSYKIIANDAAEPVRCNGTNCFSANDLQFIIDKAGSNGNYLSLSGGTQHTSTVNVDAVPPARLSVRDTSPSNLSSKTIQIETANIESNAKVEYTINGGAEWKTITSPYTIPVITTPNKYTVLARQTDHAGNVSPNSTPLEFTISVCNLIAVSCDNPDGAYKLGDTLAFKLVFGGKVYSPSSGGAKITVGGPAGSTGGDVTINFPALAKANADFSLAYTWTIPANLIWDPLQIKSIDISGVKVNENDSTPVYTDSVRTDYNARRTGVKVLSVRPSITLINDLAITANNIVLASANTTVKLTFSQKVWPEKGLITIKPAANWHIPPVLSNDDYSKVYNAAATSAYKSYLSDNYIKTTHGLLKNGSNQYTGTPDTATKYVLKFEHNLSDTTGTVNNIRTALNSAKYLWQEIESVSASQVSGAGGTAITLTLDKLPDGRQWKIEIEEGAFRDEAGNTFAGWGASPAYTFWSEKTAEPVIRVNRISNNNSTVNPTTNTVSGTLGTSNEVTSRVNVQYRIDCETPGASITYGTNTSKIATITSALTDANIYKANSNDGGQNSTLADATAAELANTTFINPTTAYTADSKLTIGDNSLYTARKDYIAAKATRNLLTASSTGYEGAFKTIIVYRYLSDNGNIGNQMNTGWLKFEATDTRNGAVTTAGFPMNYNDRTGKGSKYAFRNAASNTTYTCDWIWISWEIVCDFWQVGMRLNSNTPNSAFTEDAWKPFDDEWYTHIFRKYGNWGLKVGGE
jgi:hypothetical protein